MKCQVDGFAHESILPDVDASLECSVQGVTLVRHFVVVLDVLHPLLLLTDPSVFVNGFVRREGMILWHAVNALHARRGSTEIVVC